MLRLEHIWNIKKAVQDMNNEQLTEKVSVNINTSTLSGIDLLVDNGYYSNRSDFINQALRESLQKHQKTIDRIIDEKTDPDRENPNHWFLGVYGLEQRELEAAKRKGQTMKIVGYGVFAVSDSVDEELLFEVVESIKIKGKSVCSKSIKEHYGLK